ncbi:methylmalonyl Co-A mutase-associated GTPase MeaB [Brevibacillus daliensis]|uniref:methylmalonyl Co-A mutase-associated GTPase MeaB n=1 Tax=Brevibacillus daliensis TaxID=2892995 RepID=UPI001E620311|nr:methylmalonyl Co-A mutase-associated GTPase MeaB [Brevibacillus daliensis]
MHPITKRILSGDVRAAARAITWIEDDFPDKAQILREIYPHTGKAILIGFTGSPGAGKSSLVDALLTFLRAESLTVGVVAVDPTSPFTGGALLGDRVRMQHHAPDPGVFIRSMGTRGNLGGLSRHTKEAVRILDAYGCDVVIIETVGVGQTELDIMKAADTTLVVLNPGGGDSVQAFKAGIMEIADLFVINKSDIPGVQKLEIEVEQMLDLVKHDATWRPPIIKTIATEQKGMQELWQEIKRHTNHLRASGEGEERKVYRMRQEVTELVNQQLYNLLLQRLQEEAFASDIEEAVDRQIDPYAVAERMVRQLIKQESESS